MATNLGTKLTTTRPPWKTIAPCLHLSPIFGSGLSDDVAKISPLLNPVAMATKFGTKFTRSPWKIIARCLHLYFLFSGPGYPTVSFKFFLCPPPLHKNDHNLATTKDNCTLFLPTPIFGPDYAMVSCKFLPWRPLLSWQPTVFIQRKNWLHPHKSVKRWNAAARLYM